MKNLLNRSQMFLKRNAPTILTCVGAVGVVATSVMAVKATPKALRCLEDAREEKGEELTKLEVVKVAGPAYIPAVVMGAATIACIFSANVLNKRKQAALISAYALLDNSYKEYKKKVIELYGDDADQLVREEIVKDKYEERDISLEDDSKQLFYDEFSDRYFESTMENVLKAEYEVNRKLSSHSGLYLNEFYELLGVPPVDYGDHLGWSAAEVYDMCWESWIDFYHKKVDMDDGFDCFIISFSPDPTFNFEDY